MTTKTIDFYKLNPETLDAQFKGAVVVDSSENEITVIEGDRQFEDFVTDQFKYLYSFRQEGVLLFPKDGEKFIERALARFSGSRFWARLRQWNQ